MLRVLFIGDIVGKGGRRAVKELLPQIVQDNNIDIVIANAENAAGGNGITKEIADELISNGINFLTMGNHVWDKKDVFDFIDGYPKIIRPANYPPGTPGKGFNFINYKDLKVAVVNMSGRVFLNPLDCPFRTMDAVINIIKDQTNIILVDFHAEATSEKIAFGWYLDGKVSAVLGTHTHVQTADERILIKGTGYISDLGMTGPRNSVLGVKTDLVINKFLTQMPVRFETASGPVQLNGVIIDIDSKTGEATNINRVQKFLE